MAVTRSQVCAMWMDGRPCDWRGADGETCAGFKCCTSQTPSHSNYRAALSNAAAKCPHPSGDRWAMAGADVEPTPAEAFAAAPDVRRVTRKLRKCIRCGEFAKPLTCEIEGELSLKIAQPGFACPIGVFGENG